MNKALLTRVARITMAAAMAAGCLAVQAQQGTTLPAPPISPVLRVTGASVPVEIRRVQVDAHVAGLTVQTRIELEVFNPTARVLEGELQFPLQAGQSVTGFALDIDGELRPAVPVDKAKGRQVFEDVTRARVDPALLEATEGNNYKLRVYPLSARGSRRLVLEIAETLGRSGAGPRAGAAYVMPIAFGTTVQRLDVAVHVPSAAGARAPSGRIGAQRMAVRRAADGSTVLGLSRIGYSGRDTLRVDVPLPADAPQVVAHTFKDATYFYAEVPLAGKAQPRPAPRRVGIVWDASGSGATRDHGREIALLDAFFQSVRNVDVDLLVVRDAAEAPRRFAVAGGDWRLLREHLRGLVYDGGTRLDLMAAPAGADLALLFSDGVATFGERGLPQSAVPLFTISSADASDPARLRHAAEESGGLLLDLTRMAPGDAARELGLERSRVLSVEAVGAGDLVLESRYPQQGRVVLAGRLTEPQAEVTLELQAANGIRSKHKVRVAGAAVPVAAGLPLAAYRWSSLKLAQLEDERDKNSEAIRRLGTHFGLVTSGTSLIVLDALADYVRHDIEPPASMRAAWQQQMAQRAQKTEAARQAQVERVVQRFAQKQAWWEREFPKGERPQPKPAPKVTGAAAESQRAAPAPASAAPRMMAPPPAAPPAAVAPVARTAAPAPAVNPQPAQAAIALKKWTPDSPYARRLRAAMPDEMYAIYLDERPSYTSSTAFFLDAADIFLERGQPVLALRIMSNLAEMNLGNRQILRILAYRLLQAQQVKLALPLLRKVLVLSPDEPQSYRDLALALAADGQYQPAIERLWDVVAKPWNNRFPDIELVALAELNATRARAEAAGHAPLNVAAMDPRLLHNLSLDLRAVLSWDADNTDIDLYVLDPNGEEAYYGRQLTYQGGRMSNDFTGGYGPEEFSLRFAKPGTYTVRAEFYGHRQQIVAPSTTLMLRLTTAFGTPAQKDHEVVLRLSGNGQKVTVGTFEVPGPVASTPAPAAQ